MAWRIMWIVKLPLSACRKTVRVRMSSRTMRFMGIVAQYSWKRRSDDRQTVNWRFTWMHKARTGDARRSSADSVGNRSVLRRIQGQADPCPIFHLFSERPPCEKRNSFNKKRVAHPFRVITIAARQRQKTRGGLHGRRKI